MFTSLDDCGLTLNHNKCEFNKQQLEFFGFIFSADGISADPQKVAASHQAFVPKDPADIRSLLGMANYSPRFIKDFSTSKNTSLYYYCTSTCSQRPSGHSQEQWRPPHSQNNRYAGLPFSKLGKLNMALTWTKGVMNNIFILFLFLFEILLKQYLEYVPLY